MINKLSIAKNAAKKAKKIAMSFINDPGILKNDLFEDCNSNTYPSIDNDPTVFSD